MKAAFIRIALSKTSDPNGLETLREIESAAQAFENADTSFIDRINANKALRGESPTQLSQNERAQLDELAHDQAALDADLLDQLSRLESAQAVIRALHFGLTQDIPRSRGMLKHYPAADYPLGEELVMLKEKLAAAMAAYLSQSPDEGQR